MLNWSAKRRPSRTRPTAYGFLSVGRAMPYKCHASTIPQYWESLIAYQRPLRTASNFPRFSSTRKVPHVVVPKLPQKVVKGPGVGFCRSTSAVIFQRPKGTRCRFAAGNGKVRCWAAKVVVACRDVVTTVPRCRDCTALVRHFAV